MKVSAAIVVKTDDGAYALDITAGGQEWTVGPEVHRVMLSNGWVELIPRPYARVPGPVREVTISLTAPGETCTVFIDPEYTRDETIVRVVRAWVESVDEVDVSGRPRLPILGPFDWMAHGASADATGGPA